MMTVLPAAAPPRPSGRASAPCWLLALRTVAAAAASTTIGIGAPFALGLLAFVLLPTCTYGEPSPLPLKALAAGALVVAAVVPAALAGRRLWWVGLPAAALAVHGAAPVAWSLLTEPQSGFCF